MKQLILDLPRHQAFGRADFFVSQANAVAVGWIERWPEWPLPMLIVHGAQGAGKTHLANLWRERAAAILVPGELLGPAHVEGMIERNSLGIAVDNFENAAETALLHLINACVEVGGYLLLTTRQGPGSWRLILPDLTSRLRAVPSVSIEAPDDALLGAVLAKHFADRQVQVAPEVIAFIVSHMERSLVTAGEIAAALDEAALERQRPITIPLAAPIVEKLAAQFPSPDSAAGER